MITFEQRRNLLILFVAVLLLLLMAAWWILFGRGGRIPTETTPPAPTPSSTVRELPAPAPLAPVTPQTASAEVVVRNFVERYGTYSTDNSYANFDDVKDLATATFFASLKRAAPPSDVYKGVTTHYLSKQLTSGSEAQGSMTFIVTVQQEAFADTRQKAVVSYPKATMTVVKQSETWLVNAFAWN